MIISASRRTDIPCFYSEWFMERIRAGYVLVRNPMNASQVSRIVLNPEVVDCIVFWTKDAGNIMHKLAALDELGYRYCFQYTVTPYGNDLERYLRPKKEILENFKDLSVRLGKNRVIWRYDPIIISERYPVSYHKETFAAMCEELSGYTDRVIISFVDYYRKIQDKEIREIPIPVMRECAKEIGKAAADSHIRAQSCGEIVDLEDCGILKGACIDRRVLEEVCGCRLDLKKAKGQREACQCVESIDIGAYNTCLNGCVYCYANFSESSIQANRKKHDKNSELLLGTRRDADKIYERRQKSCRICQETFCRRED